MTYHMPQIEKMLEEQIIHRCVHTPSKFSCQLWLSVIDRMSSEHENMSLPIEERKEDISEVQFFDLVVNPHREAPYFSVSLLSACIIFKRYDLFLRLFPICYKKERKHVSRLFQNLNLKSNKTVSLWKVVAANDLLSNQSSNTSTRMAVFCRVYLLLKNMNNPNFETFFHISMEHFLKNSGTLAEQGLFFSRCTHHLKWLSNSLGRGKSRSSSEETKTKEEKHALTSSSKKKGPFFLFPPMTRKFIGRLDPKNVEAMFPDASLRHAFLNNIYHNMLERVTSPLVDWMYYGFDDIFKILDGQISSYMQALHLKFHSVTMSLINRRRPVNTGLAFEVHRHKCTFDSVQSRERNPKHYIMFSLALDRESKRFFTVFAPLSEAVKLQQEGVKKWVFFKQGACTGPLTHPFLQQAWEKTGGKIHSRKFGLETSDGVLVPWKDVSRWVPSLDDNSVSASFHGRDLTQKLNLYRSNFSKKAALHRNIESSHWLDTMPFINRSFLRPKHLLLLAPDYVHFTREQRLIFHLLFWNIPEFNFDKMTESCQQLAIQLLNRLAHWKKLDKGATQDLMPFHETTYIHSHLLSVFWQRLGVSLVRRCSPSLQALHALATTFPVNAFFTLLRNTENPDLFSEILNVATYLNLPFGPLSDEYLDRHFSGEHVTNMIKLLFLRRSPDSIRRLAWQSFMTTDQIFHTTFELGDFEDDGKLREPLVQPNIQIPMMPANFGHHQIVFDRESCCIENVEWYRQFAGQINVSSLEFDVKIKDEEGMGYSVYAEIMRSLWQRMVRKGVMVMYDCEKGGLCIGSNLSSMFRGDVHQEWLFALGFFSGLCVSRGLYLPYPLYEGLWRYLYMDDQSGITLVPSSSIFKERFSASMQMLNGMSNQEIQQNLYLSDEEVNFQTREDLVTSNFLPKTMDLMNFKAGWLVFMNRVSLFSLAPYLNSMFSEPASHVINHDNFLRCFQQQDPEDITFLNYVKTLTPANVEKLLQFITGKRRLPLCEIGEDKISVVWSGERLRLPTAQNCTHTLIMPANARKASTEEITKLMAPVFKFDTVFGLP